MTTDRRRMHGLKRLLIRLFPNEFRREHQAEILAFWAAQGEERRYAGVWGSVRLAAHLVRDAVVRGVGLRIHSGRGQPSMGREGEAQRTLISGSELRYALRSLRRAPLFTAVAVMTLALGIGATTALFSVVNGVLLRPLPYPESERLVRVERVSPEGQADDVAWPDFRDWREQARGFVGMAAYAESRSAFRWDDITESLNGAIVTRDFFEVMGVAPAMGRTFTAEEDRMSGPDAVIISHEVWQSRFGGSPEVLGRSVLIDDETTPIVGVMPPGFGAPYEDIAYWSPLQDDELLARVGLPTGERSLSFLDVVARLDETPAPLAEAGLVAMVQRIDTEVGREEADAVRLRSLHETVVGDVRSTLLLLMGAVVLVMVVACANVAGLSISRATTRVREMAVRSALGAHASHLFRLVLVESLVLAAIAGVLGLMLAVGLTRAVVALAPPGLPRVDELGLGASDLGFALGTTLFSAFLFGLAPALRAAGVKLRATIASGERGSSEGLSALRPQRVLVVLQVATSVVLLSGAALLTNSLSRLLNEERGFEESGVLLAQIEPSDERYSSPAEIDAFYEELLGQTRALPGVVSATTTYSPPMVGNDFATRVRLESEPEDPEGNGGRWAGTVIVRDDFFDTSGTPLLRGREFGPQDRLGEPPVAIVNRTMAETFWPDQDPLGQRFYFAGGLRGSADDFSRAYFPREAYTVVGVAGDVRRTSLAEAPEPEYYRPHRQITWGFQYLMVRTAVDPATVASGLREVLRTQDPNTPVPEIETLAAQVSRSIATPRFRTLILSGFAGLTCLLAMVGLYAVMAMAVVRRTREMGVRMALGASPPVLMKGVLGSGAKLVGVGIALGLGSAYLGTRWITAMLYDVQATDPATYAVVVALTAGVALLACYAPARRASLIDPVISLKG